MTAVECYRSVPGRGHVCALDVLGMVATCGVCKAVRCRKNVVRRLCISSNQIFLTKRLKSSIRFRTDFFVQNVPL